MEREEVKNKIIDILCDVFNLEEHEIDESDSLRAVHCMDDFEADLINDDIEKAFQTDFGCVDVHLNDTLSGKEILTVADLIDAVYNAVNGTSDDLEDTEDDDMED